MNIEKPSFKKICKMYMQQLTNFPYIEKDFDALTDYGILCKVVDKLNEVIKNTETQDDYIIKLYNAFVSLKDYVDDYFKNLNVQEEINNKLDEMIQDGTFAILMENYMVDDILYLHKVGILPYQHSSDGYHNMQGGCLGKEDDEFVQYQIKGNTLENRLAVISLETGEIKRSAILQLGHGNGVAYHNDKIYVTGGASDQYSNSIHIIDYDTLEVISSIPNVSYYGLTWSDYNNCFYAMNFWSYSGTKKMYKLNENLEILEEKTFDMNIGKTSANIGVIGEYIAILSLNPSNIILFDKDMNYIKSITIERNIDFMHYASEVEWINGKSINEIYFGVRLFGYPGSNGGNHLIAKSSLTKSYQGGSPTISSVTNEFTAAIRVSSEGNWHWYEDGSAALPYNNPYLASNMAQIKELELLEIRFGVQPTVPIETITLPYTYDFELNFKNCNPKIFLKAINDSINASDRIYFNGGLIVDNSNVDIHNVQFGATTESYKLTAKNFSSIYIRRISYSNTNAIFNIDRDSVIVGDVGFTFNTLEGSNILGTLRFNRYKSLVGFAYVQETAPEDTSICNIENITESLHPVANNFKIATPIIGNIGVLVTLNVPYNNTTIGFYISCTISAGHRSSTSIPIGNGLMCNIDFNPSTTSGLWQITNVKATVTNMSDGTVIPNAVINYLRFTR